MNLTVYTLLCLAFFIQLIVRFIHVAASRGNSFFSLLWSIPLHGCFRIYSTVAGHLDSFHVTYFVCKILLIKENKLRVRQKEITVANVNFCSSCLSTPATGLKVPQ